MDAFEEPEYSVTAREEIDDELMRDWPIVKTLQFYCLKLLKKKLNFSLSRFKSLMREGLELFWRPIEKFLENLETKDV
jgi:hypothetical protein